MPADDRPPAKGKTNIIQLRPAAHPPVPAQPTAAERKARQETICRDLYIRFRDKTDTSEQAIAAVLQALGQEAHRVPKDAPEPDEKTIRDLWKRMQWENAWLAHRQTANQAMLLSDPVLSPEVRLQTIIAEVRRAHEEWDQATLAYDALDSDATEEQRISARHEVRSSYNRWMDLQGQVQSAEADYRRRQMETPLVGDWSTKYDELRRALQDEYEGLGPHYDLLCERAARIHVKILQMEASGRDTSSSEYVELHKLFLQVVNQLQKYTESMKSESISRETQEIVINVLQVVENKIAQSQPALYKEILDEVDRRVAG